MGGGVLRSDVYHVFVFFEEDVFFLADFPVLGVGFEGGDGVQRFFTFQPHGVYFGVGVVVFAQRVANPVVPQEEASHVGVVDEADTEEVVDFAFVQVCRGPDVRHGGQFRVFPVGREGFKE